MERSLFGSFFYRVRNLFSRVLWPSFLSREKSIHDLMFHVDDVIINPPNGCPRHLCGILIYISFTICLIALVRRLILFIVRLVQHLSVEKLNFALELYNGFSYPQDSEMSCSGVSSRPPQWCGKSGTPQADKTTLVTRRWSTIGNRTFRIF